MLINGTSLTLFFAAQADKHEVVKALSDAVDSVNLMFYTEPITHKSQTKKSYPSAKEGEEETFKCMLVGPEELVKLNPTLVSPIYEEDNEFHASLYFVKGGLHQYIDLIIPCEKRQILVAEGVVRFAIRKDVN